jgi:ubiquinone/menaquinone biosynthesis C-methylase UbiE
VILKETFELPQIHDAAEAIYQGDPIKDRLNDRMLADALRTLAVPADALFLDAGCGSGDHAIRLCRFGLRGVGIDISGTVLRRAQARAQKAGLGRDRLTFLKGCLEALPFDDHKFDLVHCRGVLMHIPDWQSALKELCRVLTPGGTLIVFEKNSRSVETRLIRLVRLVRKSQSDTKLTYGGMEDWGIRHGHPFLYRTAHTKSLHTEMETHGLTLVDTRAGNFMGTGYMPPSVKNHVTRLNGLYYRCRLPVRFGSATIFMARKN